MTSVISLGYAKSSSISYTFLISIDIVSRLNLVRSLLSSPPKWENFCLSSSRGRFPDSSVPGIRLPYLSSPQVCNVEAVQAIDSNAVHRLSTDFEVFRRHQVTILSSVNLLLQQQLFQFSFISPQFHDYDMCHNLCRV